MNTDKEAIEGQDLSKSDTLTEGKAAEKSSEGSMCDEEVEGDEVVDEEEDSTGDVDVEPADEEEYEFVELELNDEDIVCYLEDEEGARVGFVLIEDGEEVEYFYVESDDDSASEDGDEIDFGITKEGVAQATSDMNDIYQDGAAIAGELKAAFDDIKQAFDFSAFTKK